MQFVKRNGVKKMKNEMSCWCGADNDKYLFARSHPNIEQKFGVYKCQSCGTVRYKYPAVINQEDMLSLYNTDFDNRIKNYFVQTVNNKAAAIVQQFSNYFDANYSHLDFGCNLGGFFVESPCKQVFGVDIGKYYNYCKQEGYNVHKTIPNMKFDLITMIDVIEHITTPYETLKKLYNSLSDGGKLILTTPNFRSNKDIKTNYFWNPIVQHIWYFSIPTLLSLFAKLGYKVYELCGDYELNNCDHTILAVLSK